MNVPQNATFSQVIESPSGMTVREIVSNATGEILSREVIHPPRAIAPKPERVIDFLRTAT